VARSNPARKPLHPEDVRMTLGEHLDELRGCVLRSLVALVVACLPCIWLANPLLSLIARPLMVINRKYAQPDSFLTTSPIETFVVYLKVVLICGAVIASPYIIYQLWSFVAAGLYPRERDVVHRIVPFSVGLFLVGVAFMYVFVLPLSLNFLVGFNSWLAAPAAEPTALQRWLIGDAPHTATQPGAERRPPAVQVLAHDPESPADGTVWFLPAESRLKVQGDGRTYSVQLAPDAARGLVTAHFRIAEYLTFVLVLTLAFGAAFQMPLVVLFLVQTGIVPLAALRKYRRVVIFAIVVIAGIIAPPDLFSHILLSLPMYLLFELGLLLAARQRHRAARE
jgi:Sec-independent protein secretion pathway component TatC